MTGGLDDADPLARGDRATPATWLYGIAAHKLNDWRRRGYAEDRARRRMSGDA